MSEQSIFHKPLCPQPEPVCATETRFCLQHIVELRLQGKKGSSDLTDDFKITNANTGDPFFLTEKKCFSFRDKVVLWDKKGHPVLNMKKQLIAIFKDKSTVY